MAIRINAHPFCSLTHLFLLLSRHPSCFFVRIMLKACTDKYRAVYPHSACI